MRRFHFNAIRLPLVAASVVLIALLVAIGVLWRAYATTNTQASMNDGDDNGVSIMLGLANTAVHDGRLVAPVGSNAFEFYFSVLQLDSHNAVALDNLSKAFKPACSVVEHTIAAGDLDEAQRELQLLRAYDAGNYKYDPTHDEHNASDYQLALLGGYLDAQRILLGRQHAAEAMAIRARLAVNASPQ